MEFEIKDLNPTKKSISFKFLKEEIDKEKNEIIKKYKKNINLPGFRPGKVPPEIIKARFKKEIDQEVLESLSQKSLDELLKEKDWKIVGEIEFLEEIYEDDFFKTEIEFSILPQIDVPSLEGIEIKREEVSVKDEEIEKEIERFRNSKAKLIDAEGSIKEDYLAICKLTGSYENEEKEIDFGYQYLSPTGKDPVPELLGKNIGDKIVFSKDFPPDDPSPHKGKKINFKGTIEEIKVLSFPDLNVELIKSDYPDLNSIEEFKDFLKDKILNEKKNEEKEKIKEEVVNQLLAKTDIQIPKPLLDNEIKNYVHEVAKNLYTRNYDLQKIDWEKIAKEYEPKAIKKLQKSLLLNAFAQNFGIEVTDEEVLNYIRKFCEENNLDYEKIVKENREKGNFEEIRLELKINKAIDQILEKLNLQNA